MVRKIASRGRSIRLTRFGTQLRAQMEGSEDSLPEDVSMAKAQKSDCNM